jgi:hypothetical protein
MSGKLLVTRGLGAEAVEYSKRFQQLAELPLGSDSYLAIATGTVQHGGFSMPKQYRACDPIPHATITIRLQVHGAKKQNSRESETEYPGGRVSFALACGRSGCERDNTVSRLRTTLFMAIGKVRP